MGEAKLLEGKPLAQKMREEIRQEIDSFVKKGLEVPTLTSIQVGENPASRWYVDQQKKVASHLGIGFQEIPSRETRLQSQLMDTVRKVSDSRIHGIFITMPLPEGFDSGQIFRVFNYQKDVEGIHPVNLGLLVLRRARLIPSTAAAALALIEESGLSLRGKRAAIIGQSATVGRPIQLLLGERRMTMVVCNTGTSESVLKEAVSEADLVVACAGKPGLIRGEWIKEGSVVIDIGTTEVKGTLVGDVELDEARKRASFITPVPGGVGPLTVTMLMKNLMAAYRWQKGI